MQITHVELAARIDARTAPPIVDVRSAREYREGHIPGAININFRELKRRIDEIQAPKSTEIVVYCERGNRSKNAETTLRNAGFEFVLHLEGDIMTWCENNLPIEYGDA